MLFIPATLLLVTHNGTERYKGFDMCHVFKITHLFLCIIASDFRALIWQYNRSRLSQVGDALPQGTNWDSTLNRDMHVAVKRKAQVAKMAAYES
jgi:hypothetical protein